MEVYSSMFCIYVNVWECVEYDHGDRDGERNKDSERGERKWDRQQRYKL